MTRSWHWHGGGIEAARTHFGGDDWLDLSTGINPHPWQGTENIVPDWRRLPEAGALSTLEAVAARYFGTLPKHVCALPGTEIGLRLIDTILPGPARYLAPSYRTHAVMFDGSATDRLDGASGTLILANPNNPDGRLIAPEVLQAYPDWLIVDEAFADCDPGQSIASSICDDRKQVLFRSFGKFFGLAGLRLGFVIAPTPIIAQFRDRLGAWPVSAAALTIGAAAYRDAAWTQAMRQTLIADRRALDAVLARHGLEAKGACSLFCLVETPRAADLFEQLARQAILTRPFDYAPNWIRFGLPGDRPALDRLDKALRRG